MPSLTSSLSSPLTSTTPTFPVPCFSSCVGLPDGKYPNSAAIGCMFFLWCINEVEQVENLCSEGQWFDPSTMNCDFDISCYTCEPEVTTSLTEITMEAPTIGPTTQSNSPTTLIVQCITSCVGQSDGFYPTGLLISCEHFLWCLNEIEQETNTCEDGQLFNPFSKVCTSGIQCYTCASEVTTTQPPISTTSLTETTKEPKSTTNLIVECISSCAGLPDGKYPTGLFHSCSYFFPCINGVANGPNHCDIPGFVLDPFTMECIENGPCYTCASHTTTQPSISTTPTETTVETTTQISVTCIYSCVGMPDGKYPRADCSHYIWCINEVRQDLGTCDEGQVFFPSTMECEYNGQCYKCDSEPPTTETPTTKPPPVYLPTGNYANPSNCKGFYVCIFGAQYPFWCPNGYHFGSDSGVCELDGEEECVNNLAGKDFMGC